VAIACALLTGLIIFIGPYAVYALVLDDGLRVKEDYSYLEHFWFFKLCFPWALAKPLFEPFVIAGIIFKYRSKQVATLWQRKGQPRAQAGSPVQERSWSDHAASFNGITNGNGFNHV